MPFQEHFKNCWPNEAVGYLKGGVFFPLENVAADKANTFEVDPSFLLEEPDVFLHSHCIGKTPQTHDPREPSYQDLAGQIATDIEWGIVVTDGEVCEAPVFWGNPEHRPDLIGREFIHNIQDCYCLVQDWFFQEHGIVLPNKARTPFWNEDGEDHLEGSYEAWGFKRIALSDLQPGDVLFYRVRSSVINHLGIYLGNSEVLSHWFGRLSCVEPYGRWASHIEFAARYQQ